MASAVGLALGGNPAAIGETLLEAGHDPKAVAALVSHLQLKAANDKIDSKIKS